MSQTPDEEDENDVATKTRKAWFAGHLDAADSEGGYGAGFRGVPGVRHGGSKSVTRDQISGSMDLCWCGQPFDHDWAGKSGGRPHPRVQDPAIGVSVPAATQTAPTEEQPRIERRALRAYNADLADMVLTAVNEYHVKYRITAHSVILFPPDGTQPYAVNARNGDRQVKAARAWFVRHCVPQDISIKQAAKPAPSTKPVDTDAIKELAEVMNSEEHLPKVDEPETPAEPVVQAAPEPEAPSEVAEGTEPESSSEEEWLPYIKSKSKEVHQDMLINADGKVKCKKCGAILAGRSSVAGHLRTHHSDTTTLWGPEAKAKAVDTYHTNKVAAGVMEGIELIQKAIGVTPQTADVEALTADNEKLKAENTQLTAARDDWKSKYEELKTKFDLAKEAFGL